MAKAISCTVGHTKKRKPSSINIGDDDELIKLTGESPPEMHGKKARFSSPPSPGIHEMDLLLDTINFDEAMDNEPPPPLKPKLDLSKWTRCLCQSTELDPNTHDTLLTVSSELDTDLTAVCRLQTPWNCTRIGVGDLISVLAVWNERLEQMCVSAAAGFVVVQPDHLVSGTSVVGSLFCQRKGVLADRYTGIDCNNRIMAIGSIVHELLQTVISRKLSTAADVRRLCDALIASPGMVAQLYEIEMSVTEMRKELAEFVPKIVRFVGQYITGDIVQSDANAFTGKIEQIIDIEENLWVPSLGLKGKIDVSVKIRRRNEFVDANVELMPLEVKTGRASFSLEHRGQVTIYQMMMQHTGQKVNSALLFYLRDGIMKELTVTRNEQRDLIMLRNEVAHYMSNPLQKPVGDAGRSFHPPALPAPINHHSACGKCEYAVLCCSLLSDKEVASLSVNNPLRTIAKAVSTRLAAAHVDYFVHWSGLLALEEQHSKNENELKTIWTEDPVRRQQRRRAVINLKISGKVVGADDGSSSFVHTFVAAASTTDDDFTTSGLSVGDYLRVSSAKRIAIAAGRALAIGQREIVMMLER